MASTESSAAERPRPGRPIRVSAVLLFAFTAGLWIAGGTARLPSWLSTAGQRLGLDEVRTTQMAIGFLLASAATLAIAGTRSRVGLFIARALLVVFAFAAVATIASELARPTGESLLAALAWPVGAAAAALMLHRMTERLSTSTAVPLRSPGLMLVALIAVWTASLAIASRLPINESGRPTKTFESTDDSIVLDPVSWQGRTLPDTPLSRILPLLTPLTLEGDSVIVLYNPSCGHCRELFEKHFASADPSRRVIAVEVPPPPGVLAAQGDDLGPVPCADCERLELPAGKTYLLKPPTIAVLREGRVICATDNDHDTCLAQLASTKPAAELPQ
ncbi:MAG: hypothetical protein ACKO4V_04410 [Planctomycetota bacterium]